MKRSDSLCPCTRTAHTHTHAQTREGRCTASLCSCPCGFRTREAGLQRNSLPALLPPTICQELQFQFSHDPWACNQLPPSALDASSTEASLIAKHEKQCVCVSASVCRRRQATPNPSPGRQEQWSPAGQHVARLKLTRHRVMHHGPSRQKR